MTKQQLFEQITQKNSYLCVGLDTDIKKIPSHLLKEKDPIFEFNRQIIDATAEFAVAYKPNIAFYEALGAKAGKVYNAQLNIYQKNALQLPMLSVVILEIHRDYTLVHSSINLLLDLTSIR